MIQEFLSYSLKLFVIMIVGPIEEYLCKVCDVLGHSEDRCRMKCRCSYSSGYHHYLKHKCIICKIEGHLEHFCPHKCKCPFPPAPHPVKRHECELCDEVHQLPTGLFTSSPHGCPNRCQCSTMADPHPPGEHYCVFCHESDHWPKDCPEACDCDNPGFKELHSLRQHKCKRCRKTHKNEDGVYVTKREECPEHIADILKRYGK